MGKYHDMLALFTSKHLNLQLPASYSVYFKNSDLMSTPGFQNPALKIVPFVLCHKLL